MGKGNRDSDHTPKDRSLRDFTCPAPAEAMPYISEMEVFPDEASLSVGPSDSMKLINSHSAIAHPHQSLGHSIFLKRSRHCYGHQYSRRNSGHHSNASSSRGKGALRDDRLSFKLASQPNSDIGRYSENRERSFYRPERIHSSSAGLDPISPDAMKLVCGLCEKPLRRKLYFLGNSVSSSELCVVAVLDCGHAYHGDCLEQRTSSEQRWDPPCPLCSGLLSQTHDCCSQ